MKNILLITFIAALSACGSSPAPSYIDIEQWTADHNGCMGYRKTVMEEHPELTDDLKGLSEETILQWLGKPDKNELYKRNQKFYIYLLDAGPACNGSVSNGGNDLHIRFSATNRAKEVMIYRR